MANYRIPFNRSSVLGKELEYVKKAIEENKCISGDVCN